MTLKLINIPMTLREAESLLETIDIPSPILEKLYVRLELEVQLRKELSEVDGPLH